MTSLWDSGTWSTCESNDEQCLGILIFGVSEVHLFPHSAGKVRFSFASSSMLVSNCITKSEECPRKQSNTQIASLLARSLETRKEKTSSNLCDWRIRKGTVQLGTTGVSPTSPKSSSVSPSGISLVQLLPKVHFTVEIKEIKQRK